MRLPKLIHFVVFFPLATNALTYWLSETCTDATLAHNPPRQDAVNRGRWEQLLTEIRDTAKSAKRRLNNSGDIDFARAFNYIFSTNRGADYDQPLGFFNIPSIRLSSWFSHLENLERVSQIEADVRIYCDNDARWVPKADGKGWKDVVNHMSVDVTPRCMDGNSDNGGVTYGDANDDAGGHNPDRSTITLCDNLFSHGEDAGHWLWKDIPRNKDFSADRSSIEMIKNAVTSVLIHELSHGAPIHTQDVLGARSYGWLMAVSMTAAQSIANAENWMYILAMTMFLDRGFALDRTNHDAQEHGYLVYYPEIVTVDLPIVDGSM